MTQEQIETLFTEEKLRGFIEDVVRGWEYEILDGLHGYFITHFLNDIKEMADREVKIGETKIYLEDDGNESPYTQEWLDLESTEYKLPNGVFKPGDDVDVILRKKPKREKI